MKKFLLTAALAVILAAPAFAADDVAKGEGNAAVSATVTTPVVDTSVTTEAAPAVDTTVMTTTTADPTAAAKEACTTETNEKVKLPENAGDAEKAQWDAAFAECVKGKGVEETPAADAGAAVDTTTTTTTQTSTPAVDAEAASDAAVETTTEDKSAE